MDVLVRKPPVFTIEPDSMYQRKVGETVEMHCDAQETEGTQKPTIQWQRVSVCVRFCVQSYIYIHQDINFKVLNFLCLSKGSLTLRLLMSYIYIYIYIYIYDISSLI